MYQKRIAELSNNENIINNLNNQEYKPNGNTGNVPRIIEEDPITGEEIKEPESTDYSYNDYLIQKAIRLGNNIGEILENIETGGN
ncbi:hypothetical protein [Treponema sp. R6D11]